MIALVGLPVLLFGEVWRAKWAGWLVVNGGYIAVIFYLTWLMLTRPAPDFLGVPRVVSFRKDLGLLLVQGSPWLSMKVATAIYVLEDNVERLLCVGEVQNVQSNGLIQIRLIAGPGNATEDQEIGKSLDRVALKDILVKPGLFPGIQT